MLIEINKKFPAEVGPAATLLRLEPMLMVYEETDLAHAAVKQLMTEGNDPRVVEAATESARKYERLGKPVEIAFTAIDGRKVDLAELRGKVVLVNYWATWCGPCVASIPNLKATYEKLHPQGFEVVGISMDHELAPLKKMVAERELVWPQFYDTENEYNRFADKYGISTTPTNWLIDRQGNLRYLNAQGDLNGKVTKLLAETQTASN